jgi:hypothetical protein
VLSTKRNGPCHWSRRASLVVALCTVAGTSTPAHADGPIFAVRLGDTFQSYASAVVPDAQGNTFIAGMTAAPDFPATAGAFQPSYNGDNDAFVAKLGPDGRIVWATFLGGSSQDWATGIALDGSGNVWVTGFTESAGFPLVNPIQTWAGTYGGVYPFAFVAELSPDGTKLLFSTLLGSTTGFGATASSAGIAVDSSGNIYVALNVYTAAGYPGTQNDSDQAGIFVTKLSPQGTLVYSYFHANGAANAIALDSSGAVYVAGSSIANDPTTASLIGPGQQNNPWTGQVQQAIAFKISPDGSTKMWETALGMSAQSAAAAIAVDAAGEVWIGGSTSSANFPLVHPLETTLAERPLWMSANFGATWTPIDNLPFAVPQTMVVDSTTPTTLYQATGDLGIFKSVDGGATWTAGSNGIAAPDVSALAIDPAHPQTLYAAASTTVYKSTDGANTWTAIDSPPSAVSQLLVDAQSPNNVYEVGECVTECPLGPIGPLNVRVSG